MATGARRPALALCVATLITLGLAGPATAALTFSTAPALPTLSPLTLNGRLQTTTTTMANFAVSETTAGAGWNLTVAGRAGAGRSIVFAQYCPVATCGTDTGPGYVAGGYTLPADSLTLNTTGATWTTAGTKPTFGCNAGCFVDHATATKVVSAATGVATGTWTTIGFSATSLSLATPTTLRKLQTSEVYRLNAVWTLATGP
jgi:hypothetical protein